jgi:hypothetical protein
VQREEEALVIDCQQYCLEHLVNRIYEPEPVPSAEGNNPGALVFPAKSSSRPTRSERISR